VTSTLSYDAEPPSCEATAFDASPGWTTEQRTHPAVMHRGIGFAPWLGHPGTGARAHPWAERDPRDLAAGLFLDRREPAESLGVCEIGSAATILFRSSSSDDTRLPGQGSLSHRFVTSSLS
jgi:hypothetical protein